MASLGNNELKIIKADNELFITIVNIIAAVDLAMQIARSSAPIILTYAARNIQIPHENNG